MTICNHRIRTPWFLFLSLVSSWLKICGYLWAAQGRPGRRRQRYPDLGSGGERRIPGWSPATLRTHEGTGTCAAPSRYRTLVYPPTASIWGTERKRKGEKKKEMVDWLDRRFPEKTVFSLMYCKYSLRCWGKETITIKNNEKPGSVRTRAETGHTSNTSMQLIKVVFPNYSILKHSCVSLRQGGVKG